jgi:hypothetical protein
MCGSPQPTEWDLLVTKLGLLTLSAGLLEAAVMAMHCKATNQSEAKLKSRLNRAQREGLKKRLGLSTGQKTKKVTGVASWGQAEIR